MIVAPALCGLIYMLLCLPNLGQSIWFDESYSAYLTRFDFAKIWEFTAADVHPPFFYFLLKAWAHVFGRTDYAMRMMSVVFGALAILFTYLLIESRYGVKAAILSSFLLSICPVFIRYGQEMRMYALVVAIVAAASYALWLATRSGKKSWWICYGLLVALGMWTHYFAALAWAVHLIYLFRRYGKKFWQKKIVGAYVLAIICYLPWMPSLLKQTTGLQGGGFWIGEESLETLTSYWAQNLIFMRPEDITSWLLVLFCLASGLIVWLAVKYRNNVRALLELAIVPVLLLTLLSLPPLRPIFMPRYVLYAMTSVPIIVGVAMMMWWHEAKGARKVKAQGAGARRVKKFVRQPLFAWGMAGLVIISTSICGIGAVYARGNRDIASNERSTTKELFEAVVALDNEEGLAIISDSGTLYYDLSFYASENHQTFFIDEQTQYVWGSLEPLRQSYFGKISNLDKFLKKREAVWYVGEVNKTKSELDFPREEWRAVEISEQSFEGGERTYQILKLEKE